MAPRANWKGFLRLSLVTCPVALYPATSDSEKISFNQINRKTGNRIKYAKVDADIGRVVLTNREHIIALGPLDNGLMGTLLRYPYEVRDEKEYFDEIQDVKVTKDMLDLAKHIVTQKTAEFEPEKFEDHYEEALTELINAKRNGKTIAAKPRPKGENVVDLMDALKKNLASEAAAPKGKKPRKASAGQREMLLPIEGKKPG